MAVTAVGPDMLRRMDAYLKQHMRDELVQHRQYIDEHGADPPGIRNWRWNARMEGTG